MSEHDEEALGEGPEVSQGEAFMVDTTPEVSAEDFDFDAFVQGVRPTRRSVKIHPRGDLIGVMEELEGQLVALADEYSDEDTPAARRKKIEAEYAPLEKRMEQARAEFEASGRWFTIEARSSEWAAQFDAAEDASERDKLTAMFKQVAGQVVSPKGVTVEGLFKLYEAAEAEVQLLLAAVSIANTQRSSKAQVLTRDFSLKPSAKPQPARTSGKR